MVKAIPEGLHSVTAALTIDGAAEAMAFFTNAFGAVEVMRAADPSGQKVWHAMMKIGDSTIFVNDAFPEMGSTPNKTRLWIYTDGVDAAWRRAVDAGAKVRMELADMFWGDRIGTAIDPWGNEWTLAQHLRDLSPEDMQKAQDEAVAQANAAKG